MKRSDTELIFFFQAEDGIRDLCVTGVQTCALPILETSTPEPSPGASVIPSRAGTFSSVRTTTTEGFTLRKSSRRRWASARAGAGALARTVREKIGRASCREREWIAMVGVQRTMSNE